MTKLRVIPKFFDKTDDTYYSSKELRIDGQITYKPITTPIIAMDNREIKQSDDIAEVTTGLNEIYRVLENPEPSTHDTLSKRIPLRKLVKDARKQAIFNNDIQNQIGKLSGPTIFFMEYKGKKYPQETERNFMLHTEHTYSEIPCLPITPVIAKGIIAGEQSFDDYLSFIKGSIEYLKGYNEKPIMGIIVDFGFENLKKLIELYIDQGINAFCIDFDCHTPVSHKSAIAQCFRILYKHDMLENSFFYALNVNQGRFIKNKHVINAKDILSFSFGLDAMGKRHRNKLDFTKIREKLGSRWKTLDREQNKVRLFIKSEYGYYKAENANEIKNYPLDTKIPLDTFTRNFSVNAPHVRHFEKIFNMEQLGLEAFALRKIIEDEVPVRYLERKQHADPKDIKQIKGFKESVVHPQASLDEML